MNARRVGRSVAGCLFTLAVACHGGCYEPATQEAKVVVAPAQPPIPPPPALPPVPTITGGLCRAPTAPDGPLAYGQCVLTQAMAKAKTTATVGVVLATDPRAQGVEVGAAAESYSIVSERDRTLVVGRDDVGAMYGAMDVAERLDAQGAAALPLPAPVKASPFMKIRAANLFLVLPEPGKPWWFRDPAFWTEYLDMMARGRLNFLDMHGMYNLDNTYFPNALLYLANSASMPNVGIPRAERDQNLAMLNVVIKMAETRGIKVGLMSYLVSLSLPGNEKETDEEKALTPQYNKEAVADLAVRAPGLSYLGFRIGETGRPPEWYIATYVDTLKAVHSKAVAYTRSWLTKKSDLLSLIQASGPDTIVEAKYNGEQLGPPYVISGGGMERWKSYSYEDFLEEPTPYKFVFQVRAGGTHRLFRYASYARTRRAVLGMAVSPRVQGFTLEAAHAYFPQGDFYHAHPEDSFSPWAFRRDELSYLLFGRLGYDPNTPEAIFRKALADRVGTDGLWDAVQAASDITPTMLATETCGPDQRDYAPELDIGGPVSYWALPSRKKEKTISCRMGHQPFDEFAVASEYDTANDLLEQRATSRYTSVDMALLLLADAKVARTASGVAIDPNNREAKDVVRECGVLADLGTWFAHKVRAATALAVYEGTGSRAWFGAAKAEVTDEIAAYRDLVRDTAYIAPFEEKMRMSHTKLTSFHWQRQLSTVEGDLAALDQVDAQTKVAHLPSRAKGALPNPKTWLNAPKAAGPGLVSLKVSPEDPHARQWNVTVTFATPPPAGSWVRVLHRNFRSNGGDWTSSDATGSGTVWNAEVDSTGNGSMFAVEVNGAPGHGWRYPDLMKETPYRPLAP